MSERKRNNIKSAKLQSFLKLQIINALISLALFSAFAAVSVSCDIKNDSMYIFSLAFVGVLSFICGVSAGLKERKNGIICGITGALPLNIITITVSLILNSFKPDISILITLLIGIVLSSVGGIVAVNIRLK